ncbi:hypothetical protein V6N12_063329 [Hibiscus sabdariffa]|uniref:Uncharacterized protein n=1 Tax=Hibiscus sabdariffa TaxID=183260 RepID=A0ABR2FBE3_9ROSI
MSFNVTWSDDDTEGEGSAAKLKGVMVTYEVLCLLLLTMKLLLAFSAAVLWSSVVSAQSPDFAYYNLSLIWPASFCTPATKDCISPIPKIFTISGVWPTLKNGTALPPYDPVDNVCNDSPAAPGDMAVSQTF